MSEFMDYVIEQLRPLQPISVKRMFGGSGLFYQQNMFALFYDEQLYIKADDISKALFIQEGCERFSYFITRDQRRQRIELNYYQIPDEVIDDSEALLYWAQLGIEASLRNFKKS
ncbi:MAG: TfoX/Sxy family protein [Cardiobacteriaceae bacterium]|nr:TfoX/Sxy family protein [Cardiobacteriaceae bacterium]